MDMELFKVEKLILKVFGKTTSQKYRARKLELNSRDSKNKSKITKILRKVNNNKQNQTYRQNSKNSNHKIKLNKKRMKQWIKASKFLINSQKVRKIKERK
jgi:hypothetical protein